MATYKDDGLITLSRSSRGHDRHVASRRRALSALAAGAWMLVVRPATATPDELIVALRETFGDRQIKRGRVKLDLPRLAESGNVVPVTVSVESPMTEQDYVKSVHLFAEKNNLPRILEVQLGPYNGKAVVSSRVRLAITQQVLAVAVLSDDTLWSAASDIEVTVSSCG
ncbi:MAG TPA: thiosulfate oxidation carrier protein SoxY [Burkholderiales bacterium]|nr:thiosulfate oxidation carrier protein SoxY [Burkholderiales bacterium]